MNTHQYPFTTLLITLSFLFLGANSFAQSQLETGKLTLSGKVLNEKRRGLESTIQVYKKRALIDEIKTNGMGKFQFDVSLQDSVVFAVVSEGYVSKTVWVDTKVPLANQESNYNFPFFIDLYPIGKVPQNIDLDRPVGQILFSGLQFVYDTEFTKRANAQLKEHVKERKQMKVREIED